METKNAVITTARIFIEDHGILTCFIDLDYGDSRQGFGGYDNRENLALFVSEILKVVGVNNWSDLPGKTIRVVGTHSKIESIGHIVKDIFFTPGILKNDSTYRADQRVAMAAPEPK